MQIETTRFGALAVDESQVITFPEGLPGFEGCHRFMLVPHPAPNADETTPFEWLQSVEDGAVAFLATDPFRLFAQYKPFLATCDLQSIAVDGEKDLCLYSLLTIPKGDPCGITANLLAPVVINPEARLAKQVILNNEEYGLRHRLLPN